MLNKKFEMYGYILRSWNNSKKWSNPHFSEIVKKMLYTLLQDIQNNTSTVFYGEF